jgi:hypothetical protein
MLLSVIKPGLPDRKAKADLPFEGIIALSRRFVGNAMKPPI